MNAGYGLCKRIYAMNANPLYRCGKYHNIENLNLSLNLSMHKCHCHDVKDREFISVSIKWKCPPLLCCKTAAMESNGDGGARLPAPSPLRFSFTSCIEYVYEFTFIMSSPIFRFRLYVHSKPHTACCSLLEV